MVYLLEVWQFQTIYWNLLVEHVIRATSCIGDEFLLTHDNAIKSSTVDSPDLENIWNPISRNFKRPHALVNLWEFGEALSIVEEFDTNAVV